MIPIKTTEEIDLMKSGGKILKTAMEKTLVAVKPGVIISDLDKLAEQEILKLGGEPGFKRVEGYNWTTCFSINEDVVHGIPIERAIKEGDVVGIDMGVFYKGFNTDTSWTIIAGNGKRETGNEIERFLEAGEKALNEAINQVKPGNKVADISRTINDIIIQAGYSPVKALTGHGVGKKLHEDPAIPCFFEPGQEIHSPEIMPGMVLAIEVIYNQGSSDVVLANDGWTIKTKDGKISGLFEKTVAVTANGYLILT
jgi:methionyl aminopeptidase